MASQQYIAQKEEDIVETCGTVTDVQIAWEYELRSEETGRPNPVNRDHWGTLYVNAHALRNRLDKLLEAMSGEFDQDKNYGLEKYGKNA